jgi:predicted nucleic acid-binding protein
MEVGETKKLPLVAVDTNVLLDLADDSPPVWDAIETIRSRLQGVRIVATSSVVQEVSWLAENGPTAECRALALKALKNFVVKWKFELVDFIPVGHGIIEQTARQIRAAGLLPTEEVHDSFIVAEAALAGCAILLSSDVHICQIDQNKLSLVLDARHVNKVIVTSPVKIVKGFFQKR